MNNDRRAGAAALALALATVAAFLPVLSNSFIVYDDPIYITGNSHVLTGLTGENIAWAFTTFHAANWHPLTWLSHLADAELFGAAPLGHHLVGLGLHALNAVLLFLVLRAATGAFWRSWLVAALFALHPLRVESVAWAAERKDLLSASLGFLTIGAWVRYARCPRTGRYLAVLALFALGLMAKPMLVTLPFLLLLLDHWPLDRRVAGAPGLVRSLREQGPLLALSAGSAAITLAAQKAGGAINALALRNPEVRFSNAAAAVWAYLAKAFWPAGLSVFYPLQPLPWWRPALGLGAALLLLGIAWRWRRNRPWLLTGSLWYLVALVPVLGIVQVGGQAMADRYTYLPLVGVAIILAWATAEVALRDRRFPRLVVPGWGLVIVLLAALAMRQTFFWRDSFTLFGRSLAVTEDNWMAHLQLAYAHAAAGRRDEAARQYAAVLAIDPRSTEAAVNLGAFLLGQGRAEEALALFERALAEESGNPVIHNNCGLALGARNRLSEAEAAYRRAIALDPGYWQARYNLGFLLQRLGRGGEAPAQFREALRLRPPDPEVRRQLENLILGHPGGG